MGLTDWLKSFQLGNTHRRPEAPRPEFLRGEMLRDLKAENAALLRALDQAKLDRDNANRALATAQSDRDFLREEQDGTYQLLIDHIGSGDDAQDLETLVAVAESVVRRVESGDWDSALLDALTAEATQGLPWIAYQSSTGRGYRLVQTPSAEIRPSDAVGNTPREALEALKKKRQAEADAEMPF